MPGDHGAPSGTDRYAAGRAPVPTGRYATGRARVPVDGAAAAGGPVVAPATGRAAVPPAGAPPAPPPTRRPGRPGRGRRWRRRLVRTALVTLLVLALLVTGGLVYVHRLDGAIGRIDAFTGLVERPPPNAPGTLNILLLGSDSRDPDRVDDSRADTIMLLHVPAGRGGAYLISIPRDLWVFLPPAPGGGGGHHAKINAATVFGGPPLMVATVEAYTGVRIDHVVLVDFAGFVEMTDAVGGVEMDIPQTITSIHKPYRVFEEGRQHLDGAEALDYIRQRMQFPDGDFTRMRNQQQFLRALMEKATDSGTLANPLRVNRLLRATTRTMRVDEEFSLLSVGFALRHLRGDNLTFLTSPHAGIGMVDGQSVVFSDDERAATFYRAVREDRVARWLADHADAVSR